MFMLNIEKNSPRENLECLQDEIKEIQRLLKLDNESKVEAHAKLSMMWWALDDLVKLTMES